MEPETNFSWAPRPLALAAKQVFDDHLVQRLVMPIADKLSRGFFVEGLGSLDETQEGAATVGEMIHPVFRFGRAKGMHIKADILATSAVAIALQRAHLVESAAQADVAERAVLIVL